MYTPVLIPWRDKKGVFFYTMLFVVYIVVENIIEFAFCDWSHRVKSKYTIYGMNESVDTKGCLLV